MIKFIIKTFLKFSSKNKALIQAVSFAIVGIIGIFIVHILTTEFMQNHKIFTGFPLLIGAFFFIACSFILYFLLKNTYNVADKALLKLKEHQKIEKERLKLFNFALDNSADSIIWFTFDTKIFYANKATTTMLGYSQKELLNMTLADIEKDLSKNSNNFLQKIKDRKFINFESVQVKKNKDIFPVSISASYFSSGDMEFICSFSRDITKSKLNEQIITTQNEELKKSLENKEVLIKEIHHRVKNNLEVISSLFQMQNRREKNRQVKDALFKSQSRIHSIALVHEMLYKNNNFATIDMQQYIKQLSTAMIELYVDTNKNISVKFKGNDVYLNMTQAIPIALILHELFLNSIKHAFKNQEEGVIEIFISIKDSIVEFGVKDNGIGADIEKISNSNSLGFKLVDRIVKHQLHGEKMIDTKDGLSTLIKFNINFKDN